MAAKKTTKNEEQAEPGKVRLTAWIEPALARRAKLAVAGGEFKTLSALVTVALERALVAGKEKPRAK